MKTLLLATLGDDPEPVLVGVREIPPARLLLLHLPESERKAKEVRALLLAFKFDVETVEITGGVVRSVLRAVTLAARNARGSLDEVVVNVGGGPPLLSLATLAAAALNGARCVTVVEGKVEELPLLRLGYSEVVSGSKLEVLRALEKAGGSVDSLQVLSDLSGVDKSLLSYHLRGTRESKGLEELGLVEIERGARGRLIIKLSLVGKILVEAGQAGGP